MSQEPNNIDAAISDLEGWLDRISTAIETLKYFSTQGGALPGMPPPAGIRASVSVEIPGDAFFQMTVPDAAEKYLTLMKKTKPTAEVASALLKGGLKSAAKNFTSMVNTVLSRESRFVKVNGEWGLSTWYPGMRRGNRAATTDQDSKPIAMPPKKPSKGKHKKEGFSKDSLKGRVLNLLNSKSGDVFTSDGVGESLGEKHIPSVRAAMCSLFADGLIARPDKGRYQARRGQPTG